MYYSNISGRAIVNTAIRSGMRVGGISIRFPEVFRSRPSFQRNSYVTCIVGSITLLLAVCISPTTSGQSVQMLAPDPTEELIWREEPANLVEEPPSEPFIPRVVIDPGHGYRDYGVVGVGGSREKDIVMDIALNIQELAQNDGRIEIRLTRKGNNTVSIIQRANIANRAGSTGPADALVSIHVAASFDPTVTGFQVYYPGGGAGDFEIEGVFELGKTRQGETTRRWNRQYKRHVRDSELLAGHIDARLDDALIKRRAKMRHAPLRLLRAVDMPSCLVEVAVISNSGEEARLAGKLFQQRCARSIYEGLCDFFKLSADSQVSTLSAGSR